MQIPSLVLTVLAALTLPAAFSATYYLNEKGNDQARGDSPETPWRSLHKINTVALQPGDQVLFQSGSSFEGELRLDDGDSGTEQNPVVIKSFGSGRATLKALDGNGVSITNMAHVVIQDLQIVGSGPTSNRGYGVFCVNTWTNGMINGLTIQNVEVTGFGKHGMMITGTPYGYFNVTVRACTMHDNLKGGIEVAGKLPWDAKHYAHANVLVSECQAFANSGDPNFNENHSGSGIVLYQVDGGRIERCQAWGNGAACPARGGGPVGIWACASRRVVIEYCESFGNLSKGLDGGGFDLDGGSEECVLQYNYSHDNRGPGLMAYTYPYASHRDRANIIRFNISINDALNAERYAGLWIRADGRPIEGLKVYNNTVFTSGAPAAIIHGDGVAVELRNNLFLTHSAGVPLQVEQASPSILLQNNLYWRGGGPFLVRWNGQDIKSLAEFQAQEGRERWEGKEFGIFADPEIQPLAAASLKSPLTDFGLLELFRPANPTMQHWGAHAPSHAVVGAPAEHLSEPPGIKGR